MDFFLTLGERLGEALPKIGESLRLGNAQPVVPDETGDEARARQEMAAARAHLNELVAQREAMRIDEVMAETDGREAAARLHDAMPNYLAASTAYDPPQVDTAIRIGANKDDVSADAMVYAAAAPAVLPAVNKAAPGAVGGVVCSGMAFDPQLSHSAEAEHQQRPLPQQLPSPLPQQLSSPLPPQLPSPLPLQQRQQQPAAQQQLGVQQQPAQPTQQLAQQQIREPRHQLAPQSAQHLEQQSAQQLTHQPVLYEYEQQHQQHETQQQQQVQQQQVQQQVVQQQAAQQHALHGSQSGSYVGDELSSENDRSFRLVEEVEEEEEGEEDGDAEELEDEEELLTESSSEAVAGDATGKPAEAALIELRSALTRKQVPPALLEASFLQCCLCAKKGKVTKAAALVERYHKFRQKRGWCGRAVTLRELEPELRSGFNSDPEGCEPTQPSLSRVPSVPKLTYPHAICPPSAA